MIGLLGQKMDKKLKKYCLFVMLTCAAWYSHAQEISFSHERGFYENPIQLTLSSDANQDAIFFTTDGTVPTTASSKYTNALEIDSTTVLRAIGTTNGIPDSLSITHSFIFPSQVVFQSKEIDGWPNEMYRPGVGSNYHVTHDYEMDPSIVAKYGTQKVADALVAIPTVSLAMPQDDFWTVNDGYKIEKAASAEVIYSDGTASEFALGALRGQSGQYLKRSFRLKFKQEYGSKKLKTELLRKAAVNGEGATNDLDNLVLKAGSHRSWAHVAYPNETAYTRDEFLRANQVAMSGLSGRGTFVHLYINGLYWGLYNAQERPDDNFTSDYLGGKDDGYFAINHRGPKDGIPARYEYLIGELKDKDMTVPANYAEIKEYIDVEAFAEYIMLAFSSRLFDWPESNWWAGMRNDVPGPLRFFAWDSEVSLNSPLWTIHNNFRPNATQKHPIYDLWHSLRKSDEFMTMFADLVYKHYFNDGALMAQNAIERWEKINLFIDQAVIAEAARWGDGNEDGTTRNREDHWVPEVSKVTDLLSEWDWRLINALRKDGYYPNLDPPKFNKNGGLVEAGFSIELSNPQGEGVIYYTVNGSDPRDAGALASDAVQYQQLVKLNQSSVIMARVKNGSEWSALSQFSFQVNAPIDGLFINEFVASNSIGVKDEAGKFVDWVELYNGTDEAINLAGLYISDNLSNLTLHQFPIDANEVTEIPAKGHRLFYADGDVDEGPLHLPFKLSKDGETLSLSQKTGDGIRVIDQHTFGMQQADKSEGRNGDGKPQWVLYEVPTPETANLEVQVVINSPPQIEEILDQSVLVGDEISIPIIVNDPDDDVLSLTLSSLPLGLILNQSNFITGTIAEKTGNYKTIITVTDNGEPNMSQSISFNWTIAEAEEPLGFGNELPSGLLVFPSPAQNLLHIDQSSANERFDQIQIFTSSGKLVESHSIVGNFLHVDLKKWLSGVYILYFKSRKSEPVCFKVIKE